MLLSELDTTEPAQAVPRDFRENLRWRIHMEKWALQSESHRRTVIDCCSRDLLFWIDTFVWTFNPREHADHPLRPFIAYPFQEKRQATQTSEGVSGACGPTTCYNEGCDQIL